MIRYVKIYMGRKILIQWPKWTDNYCTSDYVIIMLPNYFGKLLSEEISGCLNDAYIYYLKFLLIFIVKT